MDVGCQNRLKGRGSGRGGARFSGKLGSADDGKRSLSDGRCALNRLNGRGSGRSGAPFSGTMGSADSGGGSKSMAGAAFS